MSREKSEDNFRLRGQESAQIIHCALNWYYVCVPKEWSSDQIVLFLEINGASVDSSSTLEPSTRRHQCLCKSGNHHLRVDLKTAWLPRAISLFPGAVRLRHAA